MANALAAWTCAVRRRARQSSPPAPVLGQHWSRKCGKLLSSDNFLNYLRESLRRQSAVTDHLDGVKQTNRPSSSLHPGLLFDPYAHRTRTRPAGGWHVGPQPSCASQSPSRTTDFTPSRFRHGRRTLDLTPHTCRLSFTEAVALRPSCVFTRSQRVRGLGSGRTLVGKQKARTSTTAEQSCREHADGLARGRCSGEASRPLSSRVRACAADCSSRGIALGSPARLSTHAGPRTQPGRAVARPWGFQQSPVIDMS